MKQINWRILSICWSLTLTILIIPATRFSAAEDFAKSSIATESTLISLLASDNYPEIKKLGEPAIEPLLTIYQKSENPIKTKIAQALYVMGLKSEHAREVLMKDIHTEDSSLRLQVQWALGRVSNDDSIVKALLDNMQNDPNPLFRDKAACALAHDQVHLTEKQRVIMFEGLVNALSDEKPDVRNIAQLALQIQTGQSKPSVEDWKKWIAEYKLNIH
jgi:HEAT repeat protein